MSKEKNPDIFSEDVKKLDKLMKLNRHLLKIFTFDNSFETFLDNIIRSMIRDVENAINEKDIKPILTKGDLERYLGTLVKSLSIRLPDYNLVLLLRNVNQLVENWISMIKQFELLEIIEIEAEKFENIFHDINGIYNLLDMALSIEEVIAVTNRLTKKAETILVATPPVFNISEHFLQALKETK